MSSHPQSEKPLVTDHHANHVQWMPAYQLPGVKILWDDNSAGLDCPCGAKEIILADEEHRCECGRRYRHRCRIEVAEGPDA